ncbi:MAG: 16S rRNA (guanine(527)-N(7))-methyltransferase RsmG [Muribaculaceae bacterium]|nr:16S rRNA (guanine(527)-N(7))-methyltransferase RsmG [Muribaculaceae bacterium]
MIETILKYFPTLTPEQQQSFNIMMRLYPEWNAKINVISRKDIDNLEIHHILHSLSIAKFTSFTAGSRILDFGCGGGFPSVPLAVLFPQVHFHLIDRIAKKLKVAESIAYEIGLRNISLQHGDINECRDKFDFVVSRAVMPLPDLIKFSRKNISSKQHNSLPNGLITLKGGDLKDEIGRYAKQTMIDPISIYYPDQPFFADKYVTYTPLANK